MCPREERVRRAIGIAALAALSVACAPEEGSEAPRGPARDPEVQGAETTQVDESAGRDDSAASCFAACQNTEFACQVTTATGRSTVRAALQPTKDGCAGAITLGGRDETISLDCPTRKACVGTSCGAAMFSALSFAYAPEGGARTVCTRVK